jgi:hypothetical protein
VNQYRKTSADMWRAGQATLSVDTADQRAAWKNAWDRAVVLRFDARPFNGAMRGQFQARSLPACVPPWPVTVVEIGNIAVLVERNGRDIAAGLFATHAGHLCGPLGNVVAALNDSGEASGFRYGVNGRVVTGPDDADAVCSDLFSGLFAVSLANCRNTSSAEVRPPVALSKRHAERHGRPLVRYYTLDIEPMRKVLRTEGRMDEIGLERALHLCRGHFKDYREKGLFGRNKGLYWWDATVRGTIAKGIVAKDYRIKSE